MMTAEGLKPGVAAALEALRIQFGEANVASVPDGSGGAYVAVLNVGVGDQFTHPTTWIGFQILHNCPFPDTYPHYVRPDLGFKDGRGFRSAVSGPVLWDGLSKGLQASTGAANGLQISRRSNHKSNDEVETPVEKLLKVLAWLNSQ